MWIIIILPAITQTRFEMNKNENLKEKKRNVKFCSSSASKAAKKYYKNDSM